MTEQEELRMLRERLGPRGLEVVMIDGAGHYVNEKVRAEIERLTKHRDILAMAVKLAQESSIQLRPMSEAPKDREIFALHLNRDAHGCARKDSPDPGNFHPIQWKERPWDPNYRPRWGMRWNDEYHVTLNDFAGWIDPHDLPSCALSSNK